MRIRSGDDSDYYTFVLVAGRPDHGKTVTFEINRRQEVRGLSGKWEIGDVAGSTFCPITAHIVT